MNSSESIYKVEIKSVGFSYWQVLTDRMGCHQRSRKLIILTWATEFSRGSLWVAFLVFCVYLCRSLFILFFLWQYYCLSFTASDYPCCIFNFSCRCLDMLVDLFIQMIVCCQMEQYLSYSYDQIKCTTQLLCLMEVFFKQTVGIPMGTS